MFKEETTVYSKKIPNNELVKRRRPQGRSKLISKEVSKVSMEVSKISIEVNKVTMEVSKVSMEVSKVSMEDFFPLSCKD